MVLAPMEKKEIKVISGEVKGLAIEKAKRSEDSGIIDTETERNIVLIMGIALICMGCVLGYYGVLVLFILSLLMLLLNTFVEPIFSFVERIVSRVIGGIAHIFGISSSMMNRLKKIISAIAGLKAILWLSIFIVARYS